MGETVRTMMTHDLSEEESGKRNVHHDSLVYRLGQHFPDELEQQQMIVLE